MTCDRLIFGQTTTFELKFWQMNKYIKNLITVLEKK